MRAVNLLPEESATRLPKTAVLPLAGAAAAVLAAGVVGTLAHSESGNVARESKQLDDLKLQLSKTHAAKQTTGTTSALLASRGSRVAAVEAALSGRVAWDLVLRQIALVLPEDTWLDGLQLTSPTSPDAAATASTSTTTSSTTSTSATTSATAPTGVVINGYTKSADGLARVIQRLSVVPSLSDVTLTTAQATQRGSKRVFQFTINANIATKGAAS
jgi:Tfp pilus assembly protein PilN